MRLMGEAVEEADGDGLDAVALEVGGDGAQRGLVERPQHGAVGGDALRHAAPPGAGDQRLRPLHVDVVLLEAVLPGDLDRIAEALGRHQRRAGALAFDQRVGGKPASDLYGFV